MKTLIVTAALSLLAFSNIAEAQNERKYSTAEAHLLASLPTQDLEFTPAPLFYVTNQALLASLPTFDEHVEVPVSPVNIAKLLASLPTMDENVEEIVLVPRVNIAKLLASLPTMDENTETSVLVNTKVNLMDTKHYPTIIRLSEE